MSRQIIVEEVIEGWHAPGYRDPELRFRTDAGEFHFHLTPKAFVELHNALCMQQGCIDDNGHAALDIDVYPVHTTHIATRRKSCPQSSKGGAS